MKLINALYLSICLLSPSFSALGATIKRDSIVTQRASNPSLDCIGAEKYLGINNNVYSAACNELVSSSLPQLFTYISRTSLIHKILNQVFLLYIYDA